MAAPRGGAPEGDFMPPGDKHALHREWTYWELRKKDRGQGIATWKDQPIDLYTFGTVEDFWAFWLRAPKIRDVFERDGFEASKVEREEGGSGGRSRKVVTTPEAYMLFRKGIPPMTEAEITPGVRATQNRRRAEISIRSRDIDSWWKAWELTVLNIIGEVIDPADYIVGAYLTDKHSNRGVSLRLELWFSTPRDDIADAIAGELTAILHDKLPDLPFRFIKPSYDKKRADATTDATPAVSGGAGGAAPSPASGSDHPLSRDSGGAFGGGYGGSSGGGGPGRSSGGAAGGGSAAGGGGSGGSGYDGARYSGSGGASGSGSGSGSGGGRAWGRGR